MELLKNMRVIERCPFLNKKKLDSQYILMRMMEYTDVLYGITM